MALAVAACGSSSNDGSSSGSASTSSSGPLVGAGSTLVAPLMAKWQADFVKKSNITVTYGAIGSGGGIEQVTAGTVDFGASDAPLTPDQQKQAPKVLMVPWALSSTDVVYNVKGAPSDLKLDGPTLADIYLGKITKWNDPAIAQLPRGANLPATRSSPLIAATSGETYS